MSHEEQYNKLVMIAQSRSWTRDSAPCYVENHHILPKSMGGTDDAGNLVYLTAREHYMAHYHLAKWHRTRSMNMALWGMMRGHGRKENYTAEQYAEAKRALSEASTGVKRSAETRKKMSDSAKGKVRAKEHCNNLSKAMTGNKKCNTPEAVEKIRKANTGKVRTPEMRKKYSEAKKGKQPTKTCPHCGITGGQSNLTKYHFDNCPVIKPKEKIKCPHCPVKGSPGGQMKRYHFDNCKFKGE